MAAEVARLRWAVQYIAVPEVVDAGHDEDGSWLRTRALPGRSAVDPRWVGEPRTAARAIGAGLRLLHDRLPVAGCPFDWSLAMRLRSIRRAEDRGLAECAPAEDDVVVCHGDACAPNTVLDDEGRFVAHVDLGHLGVGDRWADLAVATYSLTWNFVGEWTDDLLDAYGIRRDDAKIAYYRSVWDAT